MGPLTATFHTTKGDIVLKLEGEKAPLTCANFVNLANRGYYNGIVFHRVIPDFMVQCGDPLSLDSDQKNRWGTGGPGYSFEDEIEPTLKHSGPGVLSMANSGPATNGSQLFITHKATDWLDGKHAVFGHIEELDQASIGVLNSIKQGDVINSIEITGTITEAMKAKQDRVDEWNKTLDEKSTKKMPFLKLKEATPMK